MKNKHLTLDNRYKINEGLDEGKSFREISEDVGKHKTTIAKEVKNNSTILKKSNFNNGANNCKIKRDCIFTNICNIGCTKNCKDCYKCNLVCTNYIPNTCEKLLKPPYVCNSCFTKKGCNKEKLVYKAKEAHESYLKLLKDSREGINLTHDEVNELNNIIVPAIKQGHSPAVIVMNNPDMNRSESSIYRDIERGVYDDIKNIDLLRKIKFKKRNSNTETEPRNTKNRENRTYNDMLAYKANHPNAKVVQFDTVEGIKGGKCLFTIHFPSISYMLAFLIDAQKAKIIVSKLQIIKNIWKDKFYIDFEIGLTDNGKEFQLPDEMEFYDDNHKMHLFYCDPGKSYQKPEIENNHTFIRRILPKGTSFDNLTQVDVNLIMNHINSTPRKELNGHTPYELACMTIGKDIINQLSMPIERNKVILKPDLLKKK